MHAHKFHKHREKRDAVYPAYKRKLAIDLEIAVLRRSIRGASGMVFRQELKAMKRVLRR